MSTGTSTITSTATDVDRLDGLLGDPWDAGNPTGFAALLEADEREEMHAESERVLDGYGLNAEFVPVGLGGRLAQVDRLVQVMRAVWRRDPCLGLGYGASSFIASVNVWSAGDERQRREVADLLLANRKVASAYHELAHGNDFSRAEFAAVRDGTGWRLDGRKEVVTNLRRADALVVFARTRPDPGSRSHAQFLVPKAGIPEGALRYLPRFPSSGMRGVQLGGAVFNGCPVPGDALLGDEPGRGIETALSSFQLTRSALPSMCVGVVDTGLRAALASALDRRLYGGAAADLPYVRAVIGRAQADLLAADAFATVVTRALHVLPEETGVSAPAVKYLVSRLLIDAMDELRTVLGARAYLRDGPFGVFQKLARDLAPAGFAHVSRAACQVTILPQLPRLARRAWFEGGPAPAGLFRLGGDLPPLDFGALRPGAPRSDGLSGTLVETAETCSDGVVGRFAARFRDELDRLRRDCAALGPRDLTIDARPEAYALAGRYTVVLAAAACLGVGRHGRDGLGDLDERWLPAALDRLDRRLGGPPVLTEPERRDLEEAMFRLARERHDGRRLLDLTGRAVRG
ncbi:acyl-CoA dehydrogenase [Actinomadura oligospora]|uniref:acyl-CoA dehydrogenase n=1 Tax=Actinomadura oligospora TaxID=111804 RepID=UPI0004B3AAF5|nr:acyl-CoA dehydrogenase [Actinomadura oligospora]